jgi:hypothetical protein
MKQLAINYPDEASRLISLLESDQVDLKRLSRAYYDHLSNEQYKKIAKDYAEETKNRTKEMMNILNKIGAPTINNIGEEASEALCVLALHSDLTAMKKVLKAFQDNMGSILINVIPSLQDKVLIFYGEKQKFGTQWVQGEDGKPFLYPLEDFDKASKLREDYGLGVIVRPKIMSLEHEDQDVLATSHDQREPTDREIKLFKGSMFMS